MSSQSSRNRSPTSSHAGLTALMKMISNMSVREINDILARRGSSSDTAGTSDVDLALSLFAEEAEGLLNLAKDHHVDNVANKGLLDELVEIEETAHYDHLMAVALSEGRPPPPRPQTRNRISASSTLQPTLASSSGQCGGVAPRPDSDVSRGRSPQRAVPSSNPLSRTSSTAISLYCRASSPEETPSDLEYLSRPVTPTDSDLGEPSLEPEPLLSCIVCGDEIEGTIIETPCGHYLDVTCLRRMFENSARDETSFPPKCCQEPIEFESVNKYLDSGLRELFERKSREFTTKDRVYCHISSCSTFLGGASKETPTALACTSRFCRAFTCGSCKYAAHPGMACADRLDDIVLELGRKRGWQRCPSCRYLVERNGGCRHIICRCGMQFCYGCAKPWGTGICIDSCPNVM